MRILAITILCLAGALALLLGLVALIGSRLPLSHVATRSTWLRQPTEQIYRLIRDFSQAPSWRSDVSSVELLGETNGKLRYRERGKHGDVTYELVEDLAGQRIVTRIVDQDLGYSGSWTIELMPENGGTRVRITENGEVSNVMFRFMSRYIFGHTSTIETYLTSLTQHFGERAAVIED
jgi:uncharacterized membrane protein